MVEFGVVRHRPVQAFGGGAALAQLGNKVGTGWLHGAQRAAERVSQGEARTLAQPGAADDAPCSGGPPAMPLSPSPSPCHPSPLSAAQPCFVFVGDVFEADPVMRQVKSLLLDYFRGRQVG